MAAQQQLQGLVDECGVGARPAAFFDKPAVRAQVDCTRRSTTDTKGIHLADSTLDF